MVTTWTRSAREEQHPIKKEVKRTIAKILTPKPTPRPIGGIKQSPTQTIAPIATRVIRAHLDKQRIAFIGALSTGMWGDTLPAAAAASIIFSL
jgi:hypothetical protein